MLRTEHRLHPRGEEVIAKVMDGEAVIINLANGKYYSLEKVGGAIWEMIEEGCGLGEIVDRLVARYDVPPAQAESDVLRLADELVKEDLVIADEQAPSTRQPAAASGQRLPYEVPQLDVYTDMEELLALDPPTPGLADLQWKG